MARRIFTTPDSRLCFFSCKDLHIFLAFPWKQERQTFVPQNEFILTEVFKKKMIKHFCNKLKKEIKKQNQ